MPRSAAAAAPLAAAAAPPRPRAAPRPASAPYAGRCRTPAPRRQAAARPSPRASRLAVVAAASPRRPVVVVDNYDSFTYNLVQYLGSLGATVVVHPNDAITVDEILALDPAGVLVSPGPGAPRESGISLDVVARCGPLLPTLGVCMGHQCIGEAYGGSVVRAPGGVVHGKAHPVHHANVGVLAGLPSPFQAARYHSLVIDKDTCPDCLEVTAWTEDGTIMAVRHKEFPTLQGVQFHPESVITEGGMGIMRNWVESL